MGTHPPYTEEKAYAAELASKGWSTFEVSYGLGQRWPELSLYVRDNIAMYAVRDYASRSSSRS